MPFGREIMGPGPEEIGIEKELRREDLKRLKLERFAEMVSAKKGPIKPKEWRRLENAWSAEEVGNREIGGKLLIKGLESPYYGTISKSIDNLGRLSEFEEPEFNTLKEKTVNKLVEISDPEIEVGDPDLDKNREYVEERNPLYKDGRRERLYFKRLALENAFRIAQSTEDPRLLEETYKGCKKVLEKDMRSIGLEGENRVYPIMYQIAEQNPDRTEDIFKALIDRASVIAKSGRGGPENIYLAQELIETIEELSGKIENEKLVKKAEESKGDLTEFIKAAGKSYEIWSRGRRRREEMRKIREGA